MQEMVRVSKEKCESLHFYKYLCHKIGSEEVVRMRRLALCISDMSDISGGGSIYSGSKGEGLDLKGSDLDLMFIDTNFKVYESETKVILDGLTIPLIMNTEETQPCFTQLRLLHHQHLSQNFKYLCQKNHLGNMLSSEQYKLSVVSSLPGFPEFDNTCIWHLHGPCISDDNEQFDYAKCLKCDHWIGQAKPWIVRPRTSWPLPEVISKIESFGILFVPIGCKGSKNENLEWRISFSVAEKFLMFSFNQTQLLCYALLKILLKEIVEKHGDLKGLLCSYFLKTLMFWFSEETDTIVWQPDNIISCFMACLQRLLYCVRYSILLHYFIPDNNLFYSRFSDLNQQKLEMILKDLYEQGIHCFTSSDTLTHYEIQSNTTTESLTSENFINMIRNGMALAGNGNIKKVIYHYLHHSTTGLSRRLFSLYLSMACRFAPDASTYGYSSGNKDQYSKYKYDRSYLLIGSHSDAVSGWLRLASFYYVRRNYVASLRVINHALQNFTDEKIFTGITTSEFKFAQNLQQGLIMPIKEFTCIQKHVLNLMKRENPHTVVKALTVEFLRFNIRSLIIPQELQLDAAELLLYDPLSFACFLNFLCYYHLHDIKSCRYYVEQLNSLVSNRSDVNKKITVWSTPIMFGIALKLIGETDHARQLYKKIVDNNPRLSWLSSVILH